jgi:outer membrane protein assembly factor BamB
MHTSCRPGRSACGPLIAAVLIVPACLPAAAEDWCQWRGPHGNGFLRHDGPLSADWGDDGPPLLWRSAEEIPSGDAGGYGSPVVADGRVVLYVAWKYPEPLDTRTLGARPLRKLGRYADDVPAALLDRIEAARTSDELAALEGKERKAWVKQWIEEHLDEAQRKTLGDFASDRLNRGRKAASMGLLREAHAVKDKTFTIEGFDAWLSQTGLGDEQQNRIRDVVPTTETKCHDVILCVDFESGETVWKRTFPGRPRGHGSSSTPCVRDGRVYVGGSNGTLYCLDAADGEKVWTAETGGHEINSSFTVFDGKAVILCDHLTAFDAETGAELWKQKKVSHRHTSPVLWRHDGRAYLLCNARHTFCVSADDGELLWHGRGGGNSTPAATGNVMAYMTQPKDHVGLHLLRISPEGVEELDTVRVSARGASAAAHDGRIYALGRGDAAIVDGDTAEVLSALTEVPHDNWPSPIVTDGGRLVTVQRGRLQVYDISGDTLELLGEAEIDVAQCTSPALTDGRVVVRGKKHLLCYDVRGGERHPAPHEE